MSLEVGRNNQLENYATLEGKLQAKGLLCWAFQDLSSVNHNIIANVKRYASTFPLPVLSKQFITV